jgi:hypothetical protein
MILLLGFPSRRAVSESMGENLRGRKITLEDYREKRILAFASGGITGAWREILKE